MKVRFTRAARKDLRDAFDYYQGLRPELGVRFANAVADAIDGITELPRAWSPSNKGVRHIRTGAFPFGVFYAIEEDAILVLAVLHLHRDPAVWEDLHE